MLSDICIFIWTFWLGYDTYAAIAGARPVWSVWGVAGDVVTLGLAFGLRGLKP